MTRIIVSGRIKIAESSREKALALIEPLVTATREEPGNIEYGFYEDLVTPGSFKLYEEWESDEALDAHGQTAHMAAFNDAVGTIEVLDLAIDFYKGEPHTRG
ncbi:MAG: putative quinol monooxygenase [Alphaproteobacteria bacterium]